MARIEGGCACGRIRYFSAADPVMVVNCHCEDCRKTSGGAFSFNLVMPAGTVTVTGTDATYPDGNGASGKPFSRHFCPSCGTHFRSEGEGHEGIEMIKAGTLDHPEGFAPMAHIWVEQKLPWVAIPEGAPQFPRQP